MENIVIDKYKDLVSYFEELILKSKDKELIDLAKNSYLKFAKTLCKLENSDINYYIDRLETLKTKCNLTEKNNILENEIPIQRNNEEKSLEEYIYFNVYRNKDTELGDEFQKLCLKLQEDLKNPNDLLITVWIQNYLSYIDKYRNILEEENLVKYMKVLFKKYDNNGKYYTNLDKYIIEAKNNKDNENVKKTYNKDVEYPKKEKMEKVEELKEEGLKIVNIKKPNLNKSAMHVLKSLGLICICYNFGVPAALITYGIYKLYKKFNITNEKLNNFIKKHGFKINKETEELLDSNDEIVTEENIDREKYSFFKKKLIELNKKDNSGYIKKDYKKNKLTSILLKSKLVNSLKNKFTKKEDTAVLTKSKSEELMHKGLGKC